MTDILMSIKPPYVDMLLSGCKTVEIRKRAVRAPTGARIWIYATSPRQQVVASARLEAVAVEAPDEIWRTFGHRTGIDRHEFDAYVGDVQLVSALTLTEITELSVPLRLRAEAPEVRPPQSYAVLRNAGLLGALLASSRNRAPEPKPETSPCTLSDRARPGSRTSPERKLHVSDENSES